MQTIGAGGTIVLMTKFDAGRWLALAERHRVTHAMLVPVMCARLLAHPDFDRTDLSTFRVKYCTSAPFAPAMKRDHRFLSPCRSARRHCHPAVLAPAPGA